jgi:hypothetical protein
MSLCGMQKGYQRVGWCYPISKPYKITACIYNSIFRKYIIEISQSVYMPDSFPNRGVYINKFEVELALNYCRNEENWPVLKPQC